MMGTGCEKRLEAKPQTPVQPQVSLPPAIFGNLLPLLLGYRLKMPVTEVMLFPDGNSYYVCPRCHVTMEREFINFCDRCGQHLGWKDCKKAKVVYPGQRNEVHS